MSKKLTKSSLTKLNHESLDNLALEQFATPLPEGLEKAEKVEILLAMQEQAEADEKDLPAQVEEKPVVAPVKEEKAKPTHVYVRIANQEGASGDQPVFLSVNGFPVLIHREKWVKLRTFFLPALKHAVETHFFRNDNGIMEPKEVRRFNVEVRTLEQGIPNEADVLDVL